MKRIHTSKKSQTAAKPVTCSPDLIQSDDFLNSFDIPERPGDVQALIEHGLDDAETGKLVDVKKTDLPCAVLDHNGREVKDVKFHHVKEEASNKPDADAAGNGHDDNPDDKKDDDKVDSKDNDKDDEKKDKDDKSHSTNDETDQDDDKDDGDKHADDDKKHSDNDKESSDKKTNDNTPSESPIDHSDTKPEYYDSKSSAGKASTSMSLGLLSCALAVGMFML